MGRIFQFGLMVLCTLLALAGVASAQSRNALVIGNAAYTSAPRLKTPATDAAIVAETLRGAGYNVTELHDVKQETIGQSLRDFLDKVAGSGPDGAAIVYYSGHGAQSEGANYLIPVDAVINNEADVGNEAFRLNDLLDELAKIPLAARIVVLDASRDHKFGAGGDKPVAKGLAMGESIPGMLLAFAAAPGALAEDGDGDYSLYTGALVTLMRQPGLDIEQIFKAVRLEVNKATNGTQTPWMVSDLAAEIRLFAATAAEPTPQSSPSGARIPSKEDRNVTKDMLRGLSPDDAYALAVEEDTLETYQWFVELYPKHALAPQVWEIIETRREAVLWQRTLAQNTTRAYWNYLKRYPKGAHVSEAQDRLAELSAPPAPPPNYVVVPEALPPDYYDEAVGLYEVYPEGYDVQPSVFGLLAPLFLPPPPPRQHFDRGRGFMPDRIPRIHGDPVRSFTPRDRTTTRDRTATGTGTGRTRNQTGIVRNTGRTTPTGTGTGTGTGTRRIDQGSIVGRPVKPPSNPKPGLNIRPTGTPTTGRPTTGRPTGVPTTGRPVPGTPTTPGTTTTGRPTIPGTTTGRPTIPGTTTGRPTTPGTTPGVTTTGRPTLPPRPGTATTPTVAPVTPGTTPTVPSGRPTTSTRPGLPPIPGTTTVRPVTPTPGTTTVRPATPTPGTTTVRPTTPTPGVTVTPGATPTRPGLPPVPGSTTVRPATPTPGTTTVRPATPTVTPPTGRPTPPPTATPPTGRPVTPPKATPPTVRPVTPPTATPTVRPATPPTVRPTPPPVTRPTSPAVRPATPPVSRPTPPAARPTPPAARPTPPAARPTPPAARPLPPRPAAPPPARKPVCSMVNGKQVCR